MGTYHVTDITWILYIIYIYHLLKYTFTDIDSDIVYMCVSYCVYYIYTIYVHYPYDMLDILYQPPRLKK